MSNSKYPLCEAAGFGVMRNTWNDTGPRMILDADHTERILAAAPVVETWGAQQAWYMPGYREGDPLTHTARLVGIRSIVRDTAESLLREYLAAYENHNLAKIPVTEWVCRARKLLENK